MCTGERSGSQPCIVCSQPGGFTFSWDFEELQTACSDIAWDDGPMASVAYYRDYAKLVVLAGHLQEGGCSTHADALDRGY